MFDSSPVRVFADRDKIRDQLISYMEYYLELDNIDLSKTSYLSYLINVLSVLTSNLVYYNSSNYRNFFQTKAFDRDAILAWASMLGYSPELASPATCQVLVSMPSTFDTSLGDVSIKIPKSFKYYADKIIFEQTSEIQIDVQNPVGGPLSAVVSEILESGGKKVLPSRFNLDKSILYFNVNTLQETTETQEFIVPNLQPYEFYTLNVPFTGSLNSIDVVSVITTDPFQTEQPWDRYSSLFLIPALTPGYSIRLSETGAQLYFGNDIIGKQPEKRTKFKITLSLTEGSNGNIISGAINKTDRLFITAGPTSKVLPLKLEAINISPASGGIDFPTLDEIKAESIANVSATKRLVTAWDFEHIDQIVDNIPFQHATSILKRSDIKRNEICLFTDLFFEDVIVPTRNVMWDLDTTSWVDSTSSTGYYKIYSTDTIKIDNEDYYSMFNIDVYPDVKECKYYYNVEDLDASVSINRTYTERTQILPIYTNFIITHLTNPLNNYITITLNYQIVYTPPGEPSTYYDNLIAYMYTSYDPLLVEMVHDSVNHKFTLDTLLYDFPDGEQNIHFKVYNVSEIYCDVQCDVTLKKDLSDFMYSQVDAADMLPYEIPPTTLYDVPVIKKDYRDSIDNNLFTFSVIQKIVDFDVLSYRMLTDFINLKFSNTTGKLTNMDYNKETTAQVIDIDPQTLPDFPDNGDRYIITSMNNPWYVSPTCIATYILSTDSWVFERLSNKDIVYVISRDKKYIYNGETIVEMIKDIPIVVTVVIWKSDGSNITSQSLIQNVKDAIINTLINSFGYDKPLYRSEIVKIIQGLNGVKHCEIKEPNHDIFFNYDIYKDFTQEQLLEYAPQLVFIDSNSIYVEVR